MSNDLRLTERAQNALNHTFAPMAKDSFFSITEIFKDRKKLSIFLVCVGLALVSWLMLSLNKSFSTTVLIPINYVNFPQSKVLLNHVPDQLAVSLTGTGYDLLQHDDELIKDTMTINLDNLKMSVYGDYERGYLDPALLSSQLQKRLKGPIGINRVLSDSIEFLFDLKVSRTLPVKPKVTYSIQQGYTLLDSVSTSPAEVEVFGPLSILDTMSFVSTRQSDAGELNKSKVVKSQVDLEKLGDNARVFPDSVLVSIDIDQLTEKKFMLELTHLNVPDSLKLLTFPNAIEVTVQVPLSRFDGIEQSDFQLQVDYQKRKVDYPILPVELERWPSLAQEVSVSPKQVEIVVSKQ